MFLVPLQSYSKFNKYYFKFGKYKSEVLEDNPYFRGHVGLNALSSLKVFWQLNKAIKSVDPDIVHFLTIVPFYLGFYNVISIN